MAAKNVTQRDREYLLSLALEKHNYHFVVHMSLSSKYQRLVKLGLIEDSNYDDDPSVPSGCKPLTPRGLQEIQELIDKAAADKAAREAEAAALKQWGSDQTVTLLNKFSHADVRESTIEQILVMGRNEWDIEVTFSIAMCVRYSVVRKQYEAQINHYQTQTPIDIDALIREAQDARTVAGILNGMLEQGEQS
jgi:hypothetical protein